MRYTQYPNPGPLPKYILPLFPLGISESAGGCFKWAPQHCVSVNRQAKEMSPYPHHPPFIDA